MTTQLQPCNTTYTGTGTTHGTIKVKRAMDTRHGQHRNNKGTAQGQHIGQDRNNKETNMGQDRDDIWTI